MPEQDLLTQSMNSTFFGVPTIVWIAALIGIALFIWKRKPKKQEFKEIDPEKETKLKYKELIKAMGADKINKKLMYGYEFKGYLGRWANKTETIRLYEFYPKPLAKLKLLLNFRKVFLLIPNDFVESQNQKEFIINSKAIYNNNFGVITFDKNSREVLYDESFKVNSESQITGMINWLKLQAYLAVQHAQSADALDHIAEIEKSKRDEAVSEMTGKNKK